MKRNWQISVDLTGTDRICLAETSAGLSHLLSLNFFLDGPFSRNGLLPPVRCSVISTHGEYQRNIVGSKNRRTKLCNCMPYLHGPSFDAGLCISCFLGACSGLPKSPCTLHGCNEAIACFLSFVRAIQCKMVHKQRCSLVDAPHRIGRRSDTVRSCGKQWFSWVTFNRLLCRLFCIVKSPTLP